MTLCCLDLKFKIMMLNKGTTLQVLLSKITQDLGFYHSTMCMFNMQFISAFTMPSTSKTQILDYVNSFAGIKMYQFVGKNEFTFVSNLNGTFFFG